MRQIIKAIAFLAALLPSLAVAQTQLPTLPANTVLGRLGVSPGPAQAIPFSTLGPTLITSNLAVTAPLSISGLNLSITGASGQILAGTPAAFTLTPTLGVSSTSTGSLAFATSGGAGKVTVQAPVTSTNWTFKFPTTAGSNGQALTTDGTGATSWAAGTGTVNSAPAGSIAFYSTTSAAVGGNANLTMMSNGALTMGVVGSQAGTVNLSGATSGTTTLASPASGGGTMTFPAGTDTVAAIAATQTLTNKTLTSPTINTPTIAGGTHTALTGLGLRDSSAAFDVTLAANSASSALSAGRTLTLDMGNVAHTMQFGTTANTITFPSVASDTVAMLAASQTVTNKTFNTSTYNGLVIPSTTGTFSLANLKQLTVSNTLGFTGTDSTSFAFPSTSDTVTTLAAAQTLTNKTHTAPTINGGTASALTNLGIRSTGTGAFDLVLQNNENLTAQRALTLTLNNAARAINLSGDVTTAAAFSTAGANPLTLTTTGSTNVTMPASGTLATINTSQTFSGSNIFSATQQLTDAKFSSGKIYPTSDSTTALQVTKADGTTRVVNFDTTNARVGVNKTAGAFDLDVNGAVNVGSTLSFLTLDPTSLGTSTSTITGLTVNNSPSASNDYLLYYNALDGRIRKATVGSIAAGATAGVSSLNGLTGGLSVSTSGVSTVSAVGSTVTVGTPAAIKADQQTGTSTTTVVTPARQQDHDSAAKVAVTFAANAGIQVAYNATVAKISTGIYDITFTTAFSTAGTYGCSVTTDASAGTALFGFYARTSASVVRVTTLNSSFAVADPTFATVVCYGRQ